MNTRRGVFTGCVILVASAGALSCAGSVKGGNASVTVTGYDGSLYVALGSNTDVSGEFAEFQSVITGEASGASFLASLSDGARDCSASESPVLATNAGPAITSHTVSAGAITVTGGPAPVTLAPQTVDAAASAGSEIFYGPAAAPGLAPDSVITITAAGDTVPPFTLGLPLPSIVTWTQPSSPDSPWVIDSSKDLDLAWSGGTSGSVNVGIQQNTGSSSIDVDCTFAASAGAGSIAASLLAYLAPTAAAPDGSIATTTVAGSVDDSVSILVGGRWNITANAQSSTFSTSATIE